MYGWDCFDAIPIDWHLTAVFPTCEHEGEEFVYSEDLWATHGLPELWVSGLGACGHRVDGRGAANVLNTMIRRLIAGDLNVGDEHPALFDSGAAGREARHCPGQCLEDGEPSRSLAFDPGKLPLGHGRRRRQDRCPPRGS